ncbi:GntR family transcriptional regulator [bacterium]|nr:MAG: GntR family transcriptional regulator [bacterium]
MALRAIDPTSTYDAVLGTLRDAIVTGSIPAGERLVQEELAEQLGASRIPVREALRTLEAEGLVRFERNRGAVVVPLMATDAANLYRVRAALEDVAVQQAAEKRAQDLAAPLRERAQAAAEQRDLATLIRVDRAFHESIGQASGNPYLQRLQALYWSQIERVMHEYLRLERYPQHVWEEHQAIARAIEAGRGAEARRYMRRHLAASLAAVIGHLQEEHK